MRRILCAIFIFGLLSAPTHASQAAAKPTPSKPGQTHIETDPKTGAMLFIVNGTEAARLDANGWHVRENIDYNGTLTDGSTVYTAAPPVSKSKAKP